MRIAIVPSLIAPVSSATCFGGAEVAALSLAEALSARGHRVALVGVAGSGGVGLEVIEAPMTPAFVPGQAVSEDPGPFPKIFAHLSGRFDVVHAHFNDPGGLLALDRVPGAISTLHLSAVFPATTKVVRRTERLRYVAPSAFAARSYDRPGIAVIPNGVDGRSIAVGAGPRSGLAWAGRRVPEKGLDDAIEIARRTRRTLEIAGSGAARAEPWVIDRGRVAREEVARIFARAAVTLIPSTIAEAHPLVAIESLFAGTPVVGYDVGGLGEIVDERTGVLVAPGDVEAATDAVARALRLSSVDCRARAEAHFRHEVMVEAYERMYVNA